MALVPVSQEERLKFPCMVRTDKMNVRKLGKRLETLPSNLWVSTSLWGSDIRMSVSKLSFIALKLYIYDLKINLAGFNVSLL